jgi:nucleotide-binding universal stress UspA family protein
MFKTIVWATDGSEGADRVLPFAKGLAQGDDRALVAVHAKELLQGERPLHAGEHEL